MANAGSVRTRFTGIAALALMIMLIGAVTTPGDAHEGSFTHNWSKHYKRLAKKTFYTKVRSTSLFVNVGEQASDSALLDGLDSTDFAGASHLHSGADITTGTVAEARIDASIARVADVFSTVLAADGSGSGLDADLLDGESSAAFAAAAHSHTLDAEDRRRTVQWFKEAADSLGTTATSERVVFVAPDSITITDAFVLPAAALTANDTNFATITVSRRNVGRGWQGRGCIGDDANVGNGELDRVHVGIGRIIVEHNPVGRPDDHLRGGQIRRRSRPPRPRGADRVHGELSGRSQADTVRSTRRVTPSR